jgi:predicted esterase
VIDFPLPGALCPLVEKGLDGMNRLQRLLKDRMGRRQETAMVDLPGFCEEESMGLEAPPSLAFPHRLFVPEHFESRYEYPLLVWLHSDHSSEMELDVIMESTSVRNYLAIAPRAHRVSKRSKRLFRWGTNVSDLAVAEDFVRESIDEALDTLPVNPERIFVGGCGTGATVAQWIGLKDAHRFAGVISINGTFPSNRRALSSWKQAKRLPVLFMQGQHSQRCTDDDFEQALRLTHGAGLNYRFLRFEDPSLADGDACDDMGIGHDNEDLDAEMFAAANRFMMGIVTQTEISLGAEVPVGAPSSSASSAKAFGLN